MFIRCPPPPTAAAGRGSGPQGDGGGQAAVSRPLQRHLGRHPHLQRPLLCTRSLSFGLRSRDLDPIIQKVSVTIFVARNFVFQELGWFGPEGLGRCFSFGFGSSGKVMPFDPGSHSGINPPPIEEPKGCKRPNHARPHTL